jgi:hypothetical protein
MISRCQEPLVMIHPKLGHVTRPAARSGGGAAPRRRRSLSHSPHRAWWSRSGRRARPAHTRQTFPQRSLKMFSGADILLLLEQTLSREAGGRSPGAAGRDGLNLTSLYSPSVPKAFPGQYLSESQRGRTALRRRRRPGCPVVCRGKAAANYDRSCQLHPLRSLPVLRRGTFPRR